MAETLTQISLPQKVSLNLLVDRTAKRVLFAEVSKDFVDFLVFLLSMPPGAVVKLLRGQEGQLGSFGNIHNSVQELDDGYFLPDQIKSSLLEPPVKSPPASSVPVLLPSVELGNSYRCKKSKYVPSAFYTLTQKVGCRHHMANEVGVKCPVCGEPMNSRLVVVESPEKGPDEAGYVKKAPYIVTDDLRVYPMSAISAITKFAKDAGPLETKVVDFTMNEGVKLLKASWKSKTVLTDLLLSTEGTVK